MGLDRDTNGLVVLDRRACLERLAQRGISVVAITDGALPVALPVQYALVGEDVVLAAAEHGILGRCLPHNVVSICVSDLDESLSFGWTVTVTGLAEPVDPYPGHAGVHAIRRWGSVVVRVGTEHVSGRQILP
jgi:nitroimidazol reductase NimA-like FMN-containing flavoprotein (pyridoxamine 5'-phosphate oxidase superfamily)